MSSREGSTALIQRELVTDAGLVPISLRPDGYINITQIAKAAGKLVGNWVKAQDTQEYLAALSLDIPIEISTLLVTVQGRGDVVEQGTWAHPEVAIDFAAWCNKKFKIQVNRWINELRTTGHVDLRHTAANPIAAAIQYLDQQHNGLVLHVDFIERKLVTRVEQVEHSVHNRVDRLDADLEAYRRAGWKRYQRQAPKGHEQWWWDIAMRRCINPQCRVELDPLSAPNAPNHPDYDEVVPIVDGGRRTLGNMQLICHQCNLRKGRRWYDYAPVEIRFKAESLDKNWMRERDRLMKTQQMTMF